MHMRISHCLPVWSLCKIENWEPAYQICYCLLSSRQQRKLKQLLQRATADFITPDLWHPNSPDLNPAVYRICRVLQERIHRISVKNWTLMNWSFVWLKHVLASSKVSLIKRLANGEFVLMHVSKPNESVLNNVVMCCSTTVNDLLWNLH